MPIRILLADDHNLVRSGLCALLRSQAGFEVAAEAQDGRTAVRLARELAPQVVVMDIGMPDMNGMDATRQIKAADPQIKVLALSMHADKRFVHGMLEAGANGYLLKDSAFDELVRAIHAVLAGQVYLSPAITGVVVENYLAAPGQPPGRAAGAPGAAPPALTPREREVLQLVAEGQSTKDIAARLHLSVKTIETHRQQLMEKLGLFSVADLTKYAIREGLTSLDA